MPLCREENPISEILSQYQFNFTLGAIKPFSNHLCCWLPAPLILGTLFRAKTQPGGGGGRELGPNPEPRKERPLCSPQRPLETGYAQPRALGREVGVLAATPSLQLTPPSRHGPRWAPPGWEHRGQEAQASADTAPIFLLILINPWLLRITMKTCHWISNKLPFL